MHFAGFNLTVILRAGKKKARNRRNAHLLTVHMIWPPLMRERENENDWGCVLGSLSLSLACEQI